MRGPPFQLKVPSFFLKKKECQNLIRKISPSFILNNVAKLMMAINLGKFSTSGELFFLFRFYIGQLKMNPRLSIEEIR